MRKISMQLEKIKSNMNASIVRETTWNEWETVRLIGKKVLNAKKKTKTFRYIKNL